MNTCIKCGESKPNEAFNKSQRKRNGLHSWCRLCVSEYNKKCASDNPEKFAAKRKAYYQANKEKVIASINKYLENNREYIFAKRKEWYYANHEQQKEARREWRKANHEKMQAYKKKYAKNNPHQNRHNVSMRRAAKIQRTPCWLTEDDKVLIQRKYALAHKKTKNTGEKWVVDHILPLRGELVSGLHVPANLRVIKHTTNSRKSNKYEPV